MPGASTFSLETIINIDGSPVFWVALQREESKAHVTKAKTNLAFRNRYYQRRNQKIFEGGGQEAKPTYGHGGVTTTYVRLQFG